MGATIALTLLLSAASGVAASALYLIWPRRMTAEEWVLHRRAASVPQSTSTSSALLLPELEQVLTRLRLSQFLFSVIAADLALLRLAGKRAPEQEGQLVKRLALGAVAGGSTGLLLGFLFFLLNGLVITPGLALLPVAGALLVPFWLWLRFRREAGQLRRGIEHRLPRLLLGARVLLQSGAATPQGALDQVVLVHEDLASGLLREALRQRQVQGSNLEMALEESAQRYHITPLGRLADSFRIGIRHGTPMADLFTEQSLRLTQDWFAAYRERITRAPVTMTVPALIFFVMPLLVMIMFLIFTPLVGVLNQL
jgi:Flp pilus assembly protein TadB